MILGLRLKVILYISTGQGVTWIGNGSLSRGINTGKFLKVYFILTTENDSSSCRRDVEDVKGANDGGVVPEKLVAIYRCLRCAAAYITC